MARLSRSRFLAGAFACAGVAAAGRLGAARAAAAASVQVPATIRVRLFAGTPVTRVDLAGSVPLSVTVAGRLSSVSALTLDASGTLTADGQTSSAGADQVVVQSTAPITLRCDVLSAERHYNGALWLQRSGAALSVINAVDLESYVASTLASEISPGWPLESLKAQAIANRTYGVRAALHGKARPYDVSDDTSNQVYHGLDGVASSFVNAAAVTTGRIVLAAGTVADIFYSSVCGGHTADSSQLTGHPGPAYLNGVADLDASGRAYCTPAPYFAWENSVAIDAMARVVGVPSNDLGDISVQERWPDGRVRTIRVVRFAESSTDLDGHQFYARVGAVLGYKVLPSAMFDIARTTEGYTFNGHGLGHGVGVCQWGARGRASAGATAEQIIAAYLPGTALS